MPFTLKTLPKMASLAAAFAITFGLQGLVLFGFDQMASASQVAADASQVATTPSPAPLLHARG